MARPLGIFLKTQYSKYDFFYSSSKKRTLHENGSTGTNRFGRLRVCPFSHAITLAHILAKQNGVYFKFPSTSDIKFHSISLDLYHYPLQLCNSYPTLGLSQNSMFYDWEICYYILFSYVLLISKYLGKVSLLYHTFIGYLTKHSNYTFMTIIATPVLFIYHVPPIKYS